jgi:hypothetical protein
MKPFENGRMAVLRFAFHFPGYLFVHISSRERLRVLQVPGVVQLVGSGGVPLVLPQAGLKLSATPLPWACKRALIRT